MARREKVHLGSWMWALAIALAVAGILAATGCGSAGNANAVNVPDNASDAPAEVDVVPGHIGFSVDTGGAPTDDWPLYVTVGRLGDQQVSPAGSEIEAPAGMELALSPANGYFIASDGTLLHCTEVSPSSVGLDSGATAYANVTLERVDPSTTERAEYQTDIDSAYRYLVAHAGQDRADALKAEAEKLLPPENAPPADNGKLTATFIDVGQGDATLVQLPDGKNLLIDAGPSSGASAVTSALHARGVTRIDYLVATHPDADHIGGMATVIGSFDIGEVWAPEATNDTRTFEGFLDAVDAKGLTITAGFRGRDLVAPGTASYALETLGPTSREETTNESSMVIRATYGSTTMLFTGDADASEIASDCPSHVDVLKVSHHGSKTGTTASLARTLAPKVAVISYATDNDYGHPTEQCLDALSAVGAKVYGTGANGTVTVTSDGTGVTASPARAGTVVAGDRTEEKSSSASSSSSKGSDPSVSRSAARSPSAASAPPTTSDDSAETVYVTPTGKKYHRPGCRYLKKSNGGSPLSKSAAEAQGYTPCKVCKP